MTSAFRTTALAAALAAFSFGAMAEVVRLDFEDLGKQAVADKAPVAVDIVEKIYFSGAYAWATDMLDSKQDDPMPSGGVPGGFLVNRSRAFDTSDIVLSLDEIVLKAAKGAGAAASVLNSYPGQFFASITFSLFTFSDKPTLKFDNANGEEQSRELTPGSDLLLWSAPNTIRFDPLDQVRTLIISAPGFAVLGLDTMEITLTAANPGGGTVPEPASYALVGLALLAAGSASRRRT